MDAIEALTTRRSCRSFKQEQIKNQVKLWLLKIKKKSNNFQNLMRLFLEKMLILFMGHQQYFLSLSQKMKVMV